MWGSPDPKKLESRVRDQLRDGEEVLWIGQPSAGALVRRIRGLPGTFLANLLGSSGALFVFWVWLLIPKPHQTGVSILSSVIGGAALAIVSFLALWIAGQWFATRQRARRHTRVLYAITGERALELERTTLGRTILTEYEAPDLGRIRERTQPDGTADVIFEGVRSARGHGWPRDEMAAASFYPDGFFGVTDPREVMRLITAIGDSEDGEAILDDGEASGDRMNTELTGLDRIKAELVPREELLWSHAGGTASSSRINQTYALTTHRFIGVASDSKGRTECRSVTRWDLGQVVVVDKGRYKTPGSFQRVGTVQLDLRRAPGSIDDDEWAGYRLLRVKSPESVGQEIVDVLGPRRGRPIKLEVRN